MTVVRDPATAPPRTDLTFLRRRSRPKATPPAPAAGKPIDYSRPDRAKTPSSSTAASGSPALPAGTSHVASAPTSHVDYRRPDRPAHPPAAAASGSLDLSRPAAPSPPAPPGPRSGSGGLDLSHPVRPAAPSAGSLDLSATPSAPEPARAAAPRSPAPAVRRAVRVAAREQYVLGVKRPTVTLTRAQSGIGQLSVEAVCSAEVGDLRLGAVYQFRSGGSSTVQHADGHRFAPPSSRRPVLVATREEYERISVDLRQVRDIERVGIYAFSESRTELAWGGTLVLTTFGGARIELPLETLRAGRIAMLMSLYNLDGELVVRAEMETIAGDVREVARAYGYDRITWRDDRAPVD